MLCWFEGVVEARIVYALDRIEDEDRRWTELSVNAVDTAILCGGEVSC